MADNEAPGKSTPDTASQSAAQMQTFVPAISFLGYPDGVDAAPVDFIAGVESRPVTAAYLDLMKSKGLVAGN